MSSSYSEDVGKAFMSGSGKFKVNLKINSKNGVNIEEISNFGSGTIGNEREILYKPFSMFKIKNNVATKDLDYYESNSGELVFKKSTIELEQIV
jgi:hypothetical protein